MYGNVLLTAGACYPKLRLASASYYRVLFHDTAFSVPRVEIVVASLRWPLASCRLACTCITSRLRIVELIKIADDLFVCVKGASAILISELTQSLRDVGSIASGTRFELRSLSLQLRVSLERLLPRLEGECDQVFTTGRLAGSRGNLSAEHSICMHLRCVPQAAIHATSAALTNATSPAASSLQEDSCTR